MKKKRAELLARKKAAYKRAYLARRRQAAMAARKRRLLARKKRVMEARRKRNEALRLRKAADEKRQRIEMLKRRAAAKQRNESRRARSCRHSCKPCETGLSDCVLKKLLENAQ